MAGPVFPAGGTDFGPRTTVVNADADLIQAAIDAVTDNLETVYATGTLDVTNGSAEITFSTGPTSANPVYAGLDLLYDVGNDRYYEFNEGPSVADNGIYQLNEVYQGSTDATYANTTEWIVVRPNPYKILVNPGLAELTTDVTAFTMKPWVNVEGIDKESVIIRRMVGDTVNPLVIFAHEATLSGITVQCPDSLFEFHRMGLSDKATTSQTEAMQGSRWLIRDCNFSNIDPTGLDAGSDMYLSNQNYNADTVTWDHCFFIFNWDGLTPQTTGSGRVTWEFIRPRVVKHALPESQNTEDASGSTGAAFWRASTPYLVDLIMHAPHYDQATYSSGDICLGDLTEFFGEYGFVFTNGGCTARIFDPFIRMDVGVNPAELCAAIAAESQSGGNGDTIITGGDIEVLGAGAGGNTVAALAQTGTGSLKVYGEGEYNSTSGVIDYSNTLTHKITATDAAVPTRIKSLEVNHISVVIAATIADSKDHEGLFALKNTSASGTAAHTLTLTSGTFDGTATIATTNAPGEHLIVYFDSAGDGVVIVNSGVVLS